MNNEERIYTEEDIEIAIRREMRKLIKQIESFIKGDKHLLQNEESEIFTECIKTKIDTFEMIIRFIQEDYLNKKN